MAYSDRTDNYLERIQYIRCPRATRLKDRLAGVTAFLRNEEHQAQAVAMLSALDMMIDRGAEATEAHEAQVEEVLSSWGAGKFPRRDQ